uniref:GNAT family N-acetyltransferase n=1 Tax=Staphylococcus aureus TaxID=1280 RepID=UPI00210AC75D
SIIKIGRTHLQDATPIKLGQEISGWRYMLDSCEIMLSESKKHILNLAIGGTAVGTGITAHPELRGQKLGRGLVQAVEERAKAQAYSTVVVDHCFDYFEKLGYQNAAEYDRCFK